MPSPQNNLVPPPIPTRIPIMGHNGLMSKEWVAYFTWFGSQFALIESPEFTGGPTVPTAPRGTNTTQIANTEFVTDAVEVETTRATSAEDVLDTNKAPIDSPTFEGTVTQPTPTVLTGATTATAATAGAATALPATPSGYLSTSINGIDFLIPYYEN